MQWLYQWQSPDENWQSNFQFASHTEAVKNAIYCARVRRRRIKHGYFPALDKKQTAAVWRSMQRGGWKIRRRRKAAMP